MFSKPNKILTKVKSQQVTGLHSFISLMFALLILGGCCYPLCQVESCGTLNHLERDLNAMILVAHIIASHSDSLSMLLWQLFPWQLDLLLLL